MAAMKEGNDEVAVNVAEAAGGGGEGTVKPSSMESVALPLGMVLVQVFTVVTLLLSKLALNTGMRPFVLLVYRNLIAAAAVAPLAFLLERYAPTKSLHALLLGTRLGR